MTETFYRKRGRRYVPVAEYDDTFCSSYPHGTHLVVCRPGQTLRRFNVQADYAPVLAALSTCRDELADAVRMATDAKCRPCDGPISKEALAAFKAVAGSDHFMFTMGSAMDVVDALEKAILSKVEGAKK